MITLGLVPSMRLVGVGIGTGNFSRAVERFARWLVDAVLVVARSAIVFGLKQKLLHRRRAMG